MKSSLCPLVSRAKLSNINFNKNFQYCVISYRQNARMDSSYNVLIPANHATVQYKRLQALAYRSICNSIGSNFLKRKEIE